MKKVLVLGTGLVSRPLVRYLIDQSDIALTCASREIDQADALITDHPDITALRLEVEDAAQLEALVAAHDLTVSLLPAPLHPRVAEVCIRHRKHMATTSYVGPQMRALDQPAGAAGVMLLNECGVDPGLDHMSAMRVIHDIQQRGGQVVSFRSCCGGLPAPEANTNPWGYKFSWSPRAVCTAGKNAARFLQTGREVHVPGAELFTHVEPLQVAGVGELEGYPNRDSLGYIGLYGLDGIETMFRGTLRYPGWCRSMNKVAELGLLDESPVTYPPGMTFAQWMAGLIASPTGAPIREQVARYINLDPSDDVLKRFAWLGLFSNEPLPIVDEETTRLDILAARMGAKMAYAAGERDMVVMTHAFQGCFADGRQERITSTLIDYGQPNGDTSMARTVSLPVAIAARLMLDGAIHDPGVHIPVKPEIYNPILDELERMEVRFTENAE